MRIPKDLVGQQFGQWTVISKAKLDNTHHPAWICRCTCGKESRVRQNALLNGSSTRCRACSATETHGKIAKLPPEDILKYMKMHCMTEGAEHFGVSIWALRAYMRKHEIPPAPRKKKKPKPYHFKADRPDRPKPVKEPKPKKIEELVQAVKEKPAAEKKQRQAGRKEQVRKSRTRFKEAALEPGLHYEEARRTGRWPYSGQGYMAMIRAYGEKVKQC